MHVSYRRFPAGASPVSVMPQQSVVYRTDGDVPLVSCLMVTRGQLRFVRCAYAAFQAQTWRHKELVVVCESPSPELLAWADSDPQHVRLVKAPEGLTLGDLRNLSVGHARGEFLCQWDDDDLYDPQRVAICMRVLTEASADAVFLDRWLMWWESKQRMVVSAARQWEGSMLVRRSVLPIYPSLGRAEDTSVSLWLARHHSVAYIDMPQLYCYRVTGHNTWHEAHFEQLFRHATRTFTLAEQSEVRRYPCFNFAE